MSLTAERLREVLDYDPATGIFVRKSGHRIDLVGKACTGKSQGYTVIRIDGTLYRAARLAWLYMTGSWPSDLVDHADGDRSNDAFANLREATRQQNNSNKIPLGSAAGFKGVYTSPRCRRHFVARLTKNYRSIHIGTFKTPIEAAVAYNAAAIKHFGIFAKLNQV